MAETTQTPEVKAEDWEKRYKDEQKKINEQADKIRQLEDLAKQQDEWLNTLVHNYQKPKEPEPVIEDGFVDRKTFESELQKVRRENYGATQAAIFRLQYPDLVEFEPVVDNYLRTKTDPRKTPEERLKDAAESARKLIAAQRELGRTEALKESQEKSRKEAEAAGLEGTKKPPEKDESEIETPEQYIAWRQKQSLLRQGY